MLNLIITWAGVNISKLSNKDNLKVFPSLEKNKESLEEIAKKLRMN